MFSSDKLELTEAMIDTSHPHPCLTLYLVITRRVFCKPFFLNLRYVSDIYLLSGLHDFMENDPIRFPILPEVSLVILPSSR